MINSARRYLKYQETLFMGALTMWCFSLSVFRWMFAHSTMFLFLNWNLFLAFIPWAISSMAIMKPVIRFRRIWFAASLLLWLMFFPNAPYILTDLFHLTPNLSMPLWFDLVLILSYAWTGLLFGFLSLLDIERILKRSMPTNWVRLTSTMLLFLTCFGIYLGRYLRWNSWDVVTEPFDLMGDISSMLIHPAHHPRTWGVTLFMGVLLNIMYWSFKLIRRRL